MKKTEKKNFLGGGKNKRHYLYYSTKTDRKFPTVKFPCPLVLLLTVEWRDGKVFGSEITMGWEEDWSVKV
jgi:hypothetical protein